MDSQDKKPNKYWLSPEEIAALHEDAQRTMAYLRKLRQEKKEGKRK